MDIKIPKRTPLDMQILKFYLSDYNIRIHVREISRLLNINHRSVSIALKRLEDKGVMKHDLVGRSKQYFLNLDNIVTKEYIKNAESEATVKLIENHFIIKKLLTDMPQYLRSMPIIIFGSYARGEETKKSDIDMLIIGLENTKTLAKKINEFSDTYKINIHLQKSTQEKFELGMREKDNLIVEIVKNHVILNNAEFFVNLLWRYYHEK